jgi:hypothetical protein
VEAASGSTSDLCPAIEKGREPAPDEHLSSAVAEVRICFYKKGTASKLARLRVVHEVAGQKEGLQDMKAGVEGIAGPSSIQD